jgi:WD40 repeat protein
MIFYPVAARSRGDGTVWLRDPASGKNLPILTGHAGTVNRVASSPHGRLLATGTGRATNRPCRITRPLARAENCYSA